MPPIDPLPDASLEVIQFVLQERLYSNNGEWPDDGWRLRTYWFVPKEAVWHFLFERDQEDDVVPFWEPPACEWAPEGIRELCEANINAPYGGPFVNP
ncbi:MAG: hypothetical protein EXQ86_00855 [Rhodospirillales bacterium]|nr:hypothetical protein [Rhodospirillales bacterium]